MCLEHDCKDKIRYYAAKALGKLGSHAHIAIPSLIAIVEDDSNEEKPMYQTGCIVVEWVLKDDEYTSKVREAAAEALGMMEENASAAIPVLTKVLQDKNELVRKAAVAALDNIVK